MRDLILSIVGVHAIGDCLKEGEQIKRSSVVTLDNIIQLDVKLFSQRSTSRRIDVVRRNGLVPHSPE